MTDMRPPRHTVELEGLEVLKDILDAGGDVHGERDG